MYPPQQQQKLSWAPYPMNKFNFMLKKRLHRIFETSKRKKKKKNTYTCRQTLLDYGFQYSGEGGEVISQCTSQLQTIYFVVALLKEAGAIM